MEYNLDFFGVNIVQQSDVDEILKCNNFTTILGLSITPKQAVQLIEARNLSLSMNGRIEIGNNSIKKLIFAFYDSPYIAPNTYSDTIENLIDIFFYYKNETCDTISDDELIEYMASCYNGSCAGSTELLSSRELDKLARNLRQGLPLDHNE